MRKSNCFKAGAMALLASAAMAQAQTVTSIQFTGPKPYLSTAIPSGTYAGVEPENNWDVAVLNAPGENALVYSGGASFTDSGSASNGVGYSITGGGPEGSATGFAAGGDADLLTEGASTNGAGNPQGWYANPVSLTLTGLTPGDSYAFAVYVTGSSYELSQASLSANNGGGIQYFTTPNGGYSANYLSTYNTTTSPTEIIGNAAVAANYQSNYVYFSGITGVSSETFDLTLIGAYPDGTLVAPNAYDANGNGGASIISLAGVQVFDTAGTGGAVPEPSTVWMFSLGFLGLMVHVYRKRAVRI